MTILTMLKADHDGAKKLLASILATKAGKKRIALFETFKAELTAHSRAEETIFYARLLKTPKGKDDALEGTVEHQVADRLLADLSAAPDAESDEWTARCHVLQELLEHHIDEEEGEFFKTARALFDRPQLDEMGDAFAGEKKKHLKKSGVQAAAE